MGAGVRAAAGGGRSGGDGVRAKADAKRSQEDEPRGVNECREALYGWRKKNIPTGSYGTVFDDPRTETTDAQTGVDLKYDHKLASGWEVLGRVGFQPARL